MRRIWAVAAVGVAVVAGCSTNLSADEFAVRANAACEERLPELRRLMEPRRVRALGLVGWAAEGRIVVERLERQLKEVVPPRDDAGAYGELAILLGDVTEALIEVIDEVERDDHAAARRQAAEVDSIAREAERIAERLGLESCAEAARTLAGNGTGAA